TFHAGLPVPCSVRATVPGESVNSPIPLSGCPRKLDHDNVGHPVASLRDVLNCFDLEFFGIWLLCHGTSYWASGLRLEGVYFSRVDSKAARSNAAQRTLRH